MELQQKHKVSMENIIFDSCQKIKIIMISDDMKSFFNMFTMINFLLNIFLVDQVGLHRMDNKSEDMGDP